MLKKFFISAFAALALSVMGPANTLTAETYDNVKIDGSGNIILTSDHAASDEITTLQLSLKVETEDKADITFEFDKANDIKVTEYRYDPESNQLNIYMSDSEPLFDGTKLNIGAVSAKDTAGNDVSVKINEVEDSLKFVYNNAVTEADAEFDIEPATTTTTTTTTTEPATTTTTTTTATEPATATTTTTTATKPTTTSTTTKTEPATTTSTTRMTTTSTTTKTEPATTTSTTRMTTTSTTTKTEPATTTSTTRMTTTSTTTKTEPATTTSTTRMTTTSTTTKTEPATTTSTTRMTTTSTTTKTEPATTTSTTKLTTTSSTTTASMPAESHDSVKVDASGKVALMSDHAAIDEINTLQLSLFVETKADADVSFEFEVDAKVTDYRYNAKTNKLNIYISGTENLFSGDTLNIGVIKAADKSGNDVAVTVSAADDTLKYVYNNTLINVNANVDIENPDITDPIVTTTTTATTTSTTTTTATTTTTSTTATTSTTTSTTTTTKPTTTTTTSTTTTTKPTTTTTTSATTTTKPTTTTTTSTTTTTKPTTTTTTSTTTTTKPTTTTTTSTTTTTKPTTTTTTSTTTTSKPTTTTTTSTTTTTTATTTTTTSTTTTAINHIASDEDLCSWAMNDYNDKNGIMPDAAEIAETADGKYQITLTDDSENVLDVYVIDPVTGIGTDSDGNEVDLPQTGNNSLKNVLIAVGAFMMIAFGFYAVGCSGMIRRKEDEQ